MRTYRSNNTNDQLQSENMTVDFDDEVSVVDNEIIGVATCMVSIIINPYINMNKHWCVINVIV